MPAKKYILFGVAGFFVISLVISGIILFRGSDEKTSTPESIDGSLEAIGLKCESVSSLHFGSLRLLLPELAEIFERNHFCTLATDEIDETAPYIRLRIGDHKAMLKLLEEDFEAKKRSDNEAVRSMAPVIYNVCKTSNSYKIPGFRHIGAQGLLVGQYVFLGENLTSSDLVAGLEDEEVNHAFTSLLCNDWSLEVADNQESLQVDPPVQPAEERSDVHHPSIDRDVLPTLPILEDKYVFLDGSHAKPSERSGFFTDCWQIDYSLAFKGVWEPDVVDAIFTQEQLFEEIKSRIRQLYPDEDPSGGFTILLEVYEYNGKDTLVDPDTDIWNYDLNDSSLYRGSSCDT